MSEPSLLQLQCFSALVTHGSFAAAAAHLHRTHPTVFAAVASLEKQLGLVLLDRSGYRVALTEEGAAFHARVLLFLRQFDSLKREAAQLAAGEEPELRVVVGDLCPLDSTLGLLRHFFSDLAGSTRLNLMVDAIAGPWERLRDGECDLVFHHMDTSNLQIEAMHLFDVKLLPVAAPGFIGDAPGSALTPEALRSFVQCVIRDSSRRPSQKNYYLIEGARTCSVPDQLMKREIIVQGLAWGHLPLHLIDADLTSGRLVSLAGPNMRGATLPHYAMRRRDAVHGPVAERLWQHLQGLVPV